MVNKRDPRVDGWLLMSSPFPTLLICAAYIYFVKSLGPRLMKNRAPFELRKTIIAYNVVQVVFSIWIVYKGLVHAWLYRYSLRCQPLDYSDDPDELIVVQLCWWYFFCKFTEFLDTIFFVLRKKFDQITNLHVIHHSLMPAATWWGVKFTPGGHGTFLVCLILSCTLSCTRTIFWLRWVPSTRSTSGGSNTLLPCKWSSSLLYSSIQLKFSLLIATTPRLTHTLCVSIH